MSKYETTLRQIIYHYTQDSLPIPEAIKNAQTLHLPSGDVKFAPITEMVDISVDDRIAACKDILLPKTQLAFYDDAMRDLYYEIFCIENLEREIEFETVNYFLMRWKTNIKKCIAKYNILYKTLQSDIDLISDYARFTEITDNDDVTHGKQVDGTGNGSTTHGMKVETESHNESEGKTVFEDTPENELLNENYATNITKNGAEASGNVTTQNSGTDENEFSNQTKESGKTERDYNRILKDVGRNKSIPEIIQQYMDNQTNVIENMVNETSKGLFIKIYN